MHESKEQGQTGEQSQGSFGGVCGMCGGQTVKLLLCWKEAA